MNRTVYLAGPIAGLTDDEAFSWRKHATDWLAKYGIPTFTPTPSSDANLVVTRDRLRVRSCGLMLSNLLNAKCISAGTMIEFGWADAWRKPLIMVMEQGNPHEKRMVMGLAAFVTPKLERGLEYVVRLLEG